MFDPVEGFTGAESNRPDLLARLEVQNLIREIGLIDEPVLEDEAFHQIEEMARANAEAISEETNRCAVTLAPGLPAG